MAASKGPIPEWTVREQLILASAVQRSGDQNWVSVSRAVKPLVEDARPPDYFSQKNCALQYSAMLDKAKHPKRKRSSDGTPDSVTVEEQIVRQLTEKRLKELSSCISDTRREYQALKKETEQIERGELDSELAGMWERVQAELALKESTDSKGSRTRKSSTAAASGSSPEDHRKRQKSTTAASGLADKKSHVNKSPEKRSSSSHTAASATPAASEAHGSTNVVSVSPSKIVVKEEPSGTTVPLSENISLIPTLVPSVPLPSSPSSSATSTPATAKFTSKKRGLENIPIPGSSDAVVMMHDESPLPCPMTVPKEEKLQESLAASRGRLSGQPLSPDMHIIVQQPNIAAITASADIPVGVTLTGTVQDANAKNATSDIPAMTKPQSQNLPLQAPPIAPQEVTSTKKGTLTEPVSAANTGSVHQNPSKERGPDEKPTPPPVVVKQEVPTATVGMVLPQITANLATTVPTSTPATKLPPTFPSTASLSASTPPAPTTAPVQPHSETVKVSMQSRILRAPPLNTPSPTKVVPPPPTCVPVGHPQSFSTSAQSHPHLTTSSLSTYSPPPPPPPLHSPTAMTVVSSVLSDPRLSSGIVRPGASRTTPPLWPTVAQVQTTAVKTKPQTTPTKSKTSGETEKKKGSSGEDALTMSLPAEPSKQKEQGAARNKEGLSKVADSEPLQEPPLPSPAQAVSEHKKTASELGKPAAAAASANTATTPTATSTATTTDTAATITATTTAAADTVALDAAKPASKQGLHILPSYTPPPELKSPTPVPQETSLVEEAVEGKVGTGDKEEGVVTPERGASPVSPVSPRLTRSGGGGKKEEGVGEKKKEAEGLQDTSGVVLDEQVLMDASNSLHSSLSELASSPLTGGGREEAEGDILPARGRRQAKASGGSSSKKLWATRSRKRKLDIEEGSCMSVESTDLDSEEEPSSLFTSAAPSPAPSQSESDQDGGMSKKQWKKAIMLVWRHAAQHKYANLFLHPVRDDDAPGYRDVIHRPMDLSSIKRNIETGVTTTDIEFQRDMLLMFQNAFMYNSSDHDVYDMAEKMRADVMQSIQDYLSTQLQLIVESSTPKVLRSRDKEGRRGDIHDEGLLTPVKKRRTRADD